jgi:hypothetical protein
MPVPFEKAVTLASEGNPATLRVLLPSLPMAQIMDGATVTKRRGARERIGAFGCDGVGLWTKARRSD